MPLPCAREISFNIAKDAGSKARSRNLIVRKRLASLRIADYNNTTQRIVRVARRKHGAEISIEVRVRRDESGLSSLVVANSRSLVTDKEKRAVLDHRATECTTELIALQRIDAAGEIVTRVEDSVAYELEDVSMKGVRARFRDDRNYASRILPELCAVIRRLHAELLAGASGNGNG